jgi:hypothetical protein
MPTAHTASKSRVKAGDFTAEDHKLKTAIFAWRQTHAVEEYGENAVQEYGASLLISDRLVDRLVLCARSSKLHTVASIFRETGWRKDWAGTHAPSLLALILSYTPQPLPPGPPRSVPPSSSNGPLTASSSATESAPDITTAPQPAKMARAKQQCSRCKGLGLDSSGHISMYFILSRISNISNILQNPIKLAQALQLSHGETRMCSLQQRQ